MSPGNPFILGSIGQLVQLPAKAKFGVLSPTLGNRLATPTITIIKCKQSPVYGVFWPLLPHPSTDRNETRTWCFLSPRNLPIKFGTNPSTIVLVIVVTDRHTDRQTHKPTPVKTYSLAFAGGNLCRCGSLRSCECWLLLVCSLFSLKIVSLSIVCVQKRFSF